MNRDEFKEERYPLHDDTFRRVSSAKVADCNHFKSLIHISTLVHMDSKHFFLRMLAYLMNFI